MRLLFLTNFYPPHDIGGYEQWAFDVADGLQRLGHDVTILTSRYAGGAGGAGERSGHTVIRSLHLESDIEHYNPLNGLFRRDQRERENAQEVERVIREVDPDAVLVWGMWALSQRAPQCAERLLPGRVAYYICSYWPIDEDLHRKYWRPPARRKAMEWIKRPIAKFVERRLERQGYPPKLEFRHALCCSDYVRKTLVDAGKLPASAGVLFGGTDPDEFPDRPAGPARAADDPLRLVYFGRLIRDKGVHTAVEALGLLREQAENVTLTIIGGGHPEYEAHLRNMVGSLGLQDVVRFVDQVERSRIPELLSSFDAFLFTSIWPEPMARTVMEAMAMGLAVIGTDVGGQPEMLFHGENGLIYPSGNAEVLADRILEIARDPHKQARLALAGKRSVRERFTIKRMVDDMERYLRERVGSSARGPSAAPRRDLRHRSSGDRQPLLQRRCIRRHAEILA